MTTIRRPALANIGGDMEEESRYLRPSYLQIPLHQLPYDVTEHDDLGQGYQIFCATASWSMWILE
jgi:hypothetical protein